MLKNLEALLADIKAQDLGAAWTDFKNIGDAVFIPGKMAACSPDECEKAKKCCAEIKAHCEAAAVKQGVGAGWGAALFQIILQVLPAILALLGQNQPAAG